MTNKKIEAALNSQINEELWSGYFYLSISAHLAAGGYPGFANWFNIQAKEETDHAMILMNYIISRTGKVQLEPIKAVKTSWKSLTETFEDTLKHEQHITARINHLYDLSITEKDYPTVEMLRWFIDEQVEEEDKTRGLLDKLKLIGDNGPGLYMLDIEQASRTYIQATPLTGKLIK